MATYKEIRGTNIEVLSSDPSNPVEGQVWYNSTSNVLKGSTLTAAGAWATANSRNAAMRHFFGTGNVPTTITAGGQNTPGAQSGVTEIFDGTSWTEVSDLNTSRAYAGMSGDSTAALASGGQAPGSGALTEIWNGSGWTEVNDLNTSRFSATGAGSSTSALAIGGRVSPPNIANTEQWNGTNWTEVGDLNQARAKASSQGIVTAAVIAGGEPGPGGALTELWNGSNWTEVNDLNTDRASSGSTAGSDYTSFLVFGGSPPPGPPTVKALTEQWNGTNWTEVGDLATARLALGGSGSGSTSALAFGGTPPDNVTTTEEWTGAGAVQTRTFTDS